MPVLTQIADVTDRFFDAAESANTRLSGATVTLVDSVSETVSESVAAVTARVADADLPFADRLTAIDLPSIDIPFVDRLPEPAEAVTATFGFIGSGIAFNRSIAERVLDVITPEAATPEAPVAEKAPAKKAQAKKSAAKKAPAKKAQAKKSTAKKTASAKKN